MIKKIIILFLIFIIKNQNNDKKDVKKLDQHDNMMEKFHEIDTDMNNFVDASELRIYYKDFEEKDIVYIMEINDINSDGVLSKEEFAHVQE